MTTATVLGAGLVGSVMAADLVTEPGWTVRIVDRSPEALLRAFKWSGERVETREADLSDPAGIRAAVEGSDVVLGALASHLGFAALRAIIEAGHHYCDISFMPEDALELDEFARARGVTAVVDCGVAPGMSNMLAGAGVARLETPERLTIYVGGVPRERRWPFEYKAGFAPHDVIEEYTRPARFVEGGRVVVHEALDGVESLDFEGVGTLEAFCTDGLRSLIRTLPIPDMTEKTMRYPGHAALMRIFRETGLFSTEPVVVGGHPVRPLDLTSALLFPKWTYAEGEEDLTIMRVMVSGQSGGERVRWQWDLLDRADPESGFSSMARTTAYPCTIVARLIASGAFRHAGVVPPELIGRDETHLAYVLEQLAARGVSFTVGCTTI